MPSSSAFLAMAVPLLTMAGLLATPPREDAHLGLVALLTGETCDERWRGRPVRFDFVDADTGRVAGEALFDRDGRIPFELAEGPYDLRLYVRYKGGYSYYGSKAVRVTEDGWVAGFLCRRGGKAPTLMFE